MALQGITGTTGQTSCKSQWKRLWNYTLYFQDTLKRCGSETFPASITVVLQQTVTPSLYVRMGRASGILIHWTRIWSEFWTKLFASHWIFCVEKYSQPWYVTQVLGYHVDKEDNVSFLGNAGTNAFLRCNELYISPSDILCFTEELKSSGRSKDVWIVDSIILRSKCQLCYYM